MSNKHGRAGANRVPSFWMLALGSILSLLLPAGPAVASADMVGCYSLDGPGGALFHEILQIPGGLGGRSMHDNGSWGTIDTYETAVRDDLEMVEIDLASLGVNASALYGLAGPGAEEIVVVVSAPVSIDGKALSPYVMDVLGAVATLFKVGCGR